MAHVSPVPCHPSAGREQLIFKLEFKMGLLLNEHSCDLEIKLLTPQESSHAPIEEDCYCGALRIYKK